VRIYAFAEIYPSPYKSYLDTQLAQFLRDGHLLQIFSFGGHSHQSSAERPHAPPAHSVTRLPGTLSGVPESAFLVLRNAMAAPREALRRAKVAAAAGAQLNVRLTSVMRALCLPIEAPDVCIVHSLLALRHLTLLKQIYPRSWIIFYYHGGELPGMPSLSGDEAARAFVATDVVFTNTRDSRLHAISRGCPVEKIEVSPVGFDLSEFRPPRQKRYREEGVLHVLTAGRLSPEKGHIVALQAVRDALHSGVQIAYRIVGDGPDLPALRAFVKTHGMGDCVSFLGQVSREQLWQEYLAADVFLLPSVAIGTWQENQACVVQEAMLAECVPCVSLTGGVPESTLPEALDFAFQPGNADQIAASLRRLAELRDDELVALGRAGRKFVQERYDIVALNRVILGSVSAPDRPTVNT